MPDRPRAAGRASEVLRRAGRRRVTARTPPGRSERESTGDSRGTVESAAVRQSDSRRVHAELGEHSPPSATDIGDCTRCKLCTLGRKQIVFGVGNPNADLMFVGEAPGRDEDIQGIPFVGRAGQKLTQIIEAIGLKRDDVYIANVIKCRPPENRNPEPDEVEHVRAVSVPADRHIKPKVIVALGTFAAKSLLQDDRSDLAPARPRLRLSRREARSHVPSRVSAAQPGCRREVWEDMKKVRALLNGEDVA